MLRKIINVNSISVIQQNISHNIYGFQEIHYEENPIGKGGVGAVFKVVNVDGRTENGLLVKLITEPDFQAKSYETISILHDKMNQYQKQTGRPALIDTPELSGLPFLAFKANLEESGEETAGYLMHDLSYYEFSDFGAETWDKRRYITEVGFEEKLYLCYQLARGVDFLHEQKFIHSDLKDYSIFINLEKPQLSIIDYDGGYHYDKQESALTIGALTAWASAKWRKIIGQGKSAKDVSTNERLDEENWILASGIFEILFGMPPFYFLKSIDEETIDSYLRNNRWPYFQENSSEINQQNIEFHNNLLKIIDDLNQQGLKLIIDTFIKVFNDGHNKVSERLTPKQWKNLLFDINKQFVGAPRIEDFSSNTQTINSKNEKVHFNWKTHFYNVVYIDNQIQDPLASTSAISIEDTKEITIKAINDFGESNDKVLITANKVRPVIHRFITNINKRFDLTPVILSWETSNCKNVTIQGLDNNYKSTDVVEVNPLKRTIYKLTAYGFFDQEVTAELEIDVESVKIVSFNYAINIEKGIDNIDISWETEYANDIEIIPRVGKVERAGFTSIGILDKTQFTLIAKGHFTEVQKTIEAQPFPIPLIKGIFIPTPILRMETTVPENLLEIPPFLNGQLNVTFNNNITYNDNKVPFVNFNEDQIVKTLSIEKSKNTSSLLNLFDSLFRRITKKSTNT